MTMKCDCIDSSIKLHLEGALEHYIKDIRKDITRFAESAVEYKDINPELSKHYLQLVESQKAYIEKIETAKSVIKALPICGVQSGNPHPKELSVPEQHQLKIAKDTLRMPDPMAAVMGGPTKEQARAIIKELTGKEAKE